MVVVAPATTEGSLRDIYMIARAQWTILIVLFGAGTRVCHRYQNIDFRRRDHIKMTFLTSIARPLDVKASCYRDETSIIPRARRDKTMVLKAPRLPSVILSIDPKCSSGTNPWYFVILLGMHA